MKLTDEQIEQLWCEYPSDYFTFAHAIESTVRQDAEQVVRELVAVLKYHQEQTRPIHRTQDALTRAQQWLDAQ